MDALLRTRLEILEMFIKELLKDKPELLEKFEYKLYIWNLTESIED